MTLERQQSKLVVVERARRLVKERGFLHNSGVLELAEFTAGLHPDAGLEVSEGTRENHEGKYESPFINLEGPIAVNEEEGIAAGFQVIVRIGFLYTENIPEVVLNAGQRRGDILGGRLWRNKWPVGKDDQFVEPLTGNFLRELYKVIKNRDLLGSGFHTSSIDYTPILRKARELVVSR